MRVAALALGSGALGFGAATAVLGVWPGPGAALGVGAALGGLVAWAWRAEPEVEVEAVPMLHRRPEPGLQSRMQRQPERPPLPEAEEWLRVAVLQTIAPAILQSRSGRELGELQLTRVVVNDISRIQRGAGSALDTINTSITWHLEGRWSLPWRRHPLPGREEEPFEEAGTFSCTVISEEGEPRVYRWNFSSDFFESLLIWVPIQAGEFFMESASDDPDGFHNKRSQHRIKAFSLSATPVTVAQYAAVMNRAVDPINAELPVTGVSWEDAVEFCNTLSRLAGRTPCYERRESAMAWDRAADGFRLPEEDEWEYTCRAGTTTQYSIGDELERLGEYAWYAENSKMRTHPVAQKLPNPWGLYDMHGNIWEWVWDVWGDSYDRKVTSDNDEVISAKVTLLVSPLDEVRVVRGGSFWLGPRGLRSVSRDGFSPGLRYRDLGFRCAASARRLSELISS